VNGNMLMTITSYFFGLGMIVFAVRNGQAVVNALSGFFKAGSGVITDVGGINVGSGGF
jgi:hypothetical protein